MYIVYWNCPSDSYSSDQRLIGIGIVLYLNTVKAIGSIKIINNLTILHKMQKLSTPELTKTCFFYECRVYLILKMKIN